MLDFQTPADVNTAVNGWAVDQSKGLVKDIIKPEEVKPDSKAIMVNFIYFKGKLNSIIVITFAFPLQFFYFF